MKKGVMGMSKSFISYIKSDVYRYYGKCNAYALCRGFFNSTIRFQYILRMCRSRGFLKFFGNMLYKLSRTRKTIIIPKQTEIGYGLYIGHGGPVVINKTAKIGNNVNLSQFVTIGSNIEKAATIGDNVYIGPNVCIVEDVEIGNNVTIGAGSVVTKDIPDDATAAGNYAKVLNYNNPGRYIQNKWPIK